MKKPNAKLTRAIDVFPFFKHKFFGLEFEVTCGLGGGKAGAASSRRQKKRYIGIHPMLEGYDLVEVLIHEALHACFDRKLSEKEVLRAGIDVAKFLYKFKKLKDAKMAKAKKRHPNMGCVRCGKKNCGVAHED